MIKSFPAGRGPFSFVFAELTFRSARQLSEYKGKGASASREIKSQMM